MSSKNLTPFIDDSGNMHLHAREGGIAIFDFQEDDGTPRDMTNADVFFEVKDFRKALTPGQQDHQLVLTIDRGELNQFLNQVNDFIVLDETGVVPHVIIEGKVIVDGWV